MTVRTNARFSLMATLWICLLLLITITGCESWKKKPVLAPKDDITPTEANKQLASVLGDTIGGVSYLQQATRWQSVRGYGLVVGLGRNGSRECPEPLRTQMMQEIRKRLENDGIYSLSQIEVRANDLMSNLDTTVVEVTALIPPGACKGTRFDVHVQSVAGTDTRSLAGGKLYTCSLHLYSMGDQGDILQGKTVAEAAGPIFQTIVTDRTQPAAAQDPRAGIILGGGLNRVARTMDLAFSSASQRLTRQVNNRINEHFGNGQEIAKAMNQTRIQITAPAWAWQNKEQHFYELVMHLPLSREEAYLTARAAQLLDMLQQPNAPAEDIALVLEAMGQPAVEVVQRYYTDENRVVRFYAARAGLRLRDDMAVDVVAREARDRGSPFREAAVAELSNADDMAIARIPLRDLINDPLVKIRILACQGLIRHNDESVRHDKVGRNGFILDIVPSRGEAIVYATRSLVPRIVIIGTDVVCRPPFFYLHPSKVVSASAEAGQAQITLVRRTPFGQVSEPMKTSLNLGELIQFMGDSAEMDDKTDKIKGLELSYSEVLQVVQTLCNSKAVLATLEMQEAPLSDSLRSVRPMSRPESEIVR